jgi:hypothetical protein
MKKTKPAAKSAKKEVMLSRKKTPKKLERKKAKPSTLNRYGARKAKREAWQKANPGMIPGEIGKPAVKRPSEPLVDRTEGLDDAKIIQAINEVTGDPDETVPGPGDVKTAVEVADEIKMEEKLSAKVKLTAVDVTSQIGDRLDTSRDDLVPGDPGFDDAVEAK